jgi:hypothetical protein
MSQRITYTNAVNGKGEAVYWVHLDNRVVGLIQRDDRGYYYTPKGSKQSGERFPSLTACKLSLESA